MLEAPWALGALEPKKRLKRPDGGLGFGGKGALYNHRYRYLCGKYSSYLTLSLASISSNVADPFHVPFLTQVTYYLLLLLLRKSLDGILAVQVDQEDDRSWKRRWPDEDGVDSLSPSSMSRGQPPDIAIG
jgi:hypothetical protein